MLQICLPDNSDNTRLQNLEQHKSFPCSSTYTQRITVCRPVSVCMCVSWWHWLAKESLCSGFLPGPIRSALEPACCRCVWLLEKETKRLIVSLRSSRAVWVIFHKYDAFLCGEEPISSSAGMAGGSEAFLRPLIVIVSKKVIYSAVRNAGALAEFCWAALYRSRTGVWGLAADMRDVLPATLWYASCRMKTERRRTSGVADC